MVVMARKSSAAESKKPDDRQTVQMRGDWHRSLIRLAAKRRLQKVWAMYQLIGEACDAEGIERPPYPWDEMEAEANG